MNIIGTGSEVLEQARRAVELAKQRAEAVRIKVEKESSEAEEASKKANQANEAAIVQQNRYTEANTKVSLKQSEYDNAVAYLNSLQGCDDESAIQHANDEGTRLKNELDQIKANAEK